MTGTIIFTLSLLLTQNWASEKPYSLNLEPVDGYQDNTGPEAYSAPGILFHGELTNGDPGSCMLEFTGWRGSPDAEIVVEVVIDLERTVQIGLIRGFFYLATPDLSIFRAYVGENPEVFTPLHHSFYKENTSETLYMLSTGTTKPLQGRYVKIIIGMNHPGYLRCGEIEVWANPLSTDIQSWWQIKLSNF
jgi:hypothetical protein